MDQWCLNGFLDGKIIEEILQVRGQLVVIHKSMSQSNAHAATFDAEYEIKVAKALARGLYHIIVMFNNIQHHGKVQLHTVTQVKPDRIANFPLFQDDKLRQKRTGGLLQPQVKAALDAARGRVKSQS
ncbi:unnamed protein product [Fusarium equiseti]|uniref:Uncharacterized protein n=1 Tax=Fusarium equiseti TaxID=61235 RepID=A0A8J2NCJ7_FUSEQ|nr:unnamed protein product [Fusarium equiseti]